jgi:GTP pyrophosphokinase
MIYFAKCCNPLPGDKIRGFITRGRGVTVHKDDCINLLAIDPQRIVDATWSGEQQANRVVGLSIRAENRTGLLHVISGVFSSNDSDIVQASLKTVDGDHAQGTFMVLVRDLAHLTRLINALKTIKGVELVERLGSIQSRQE